MANAAVISRNFLSRGELFQKRRMEIIARIKIPVHTAPITAPGGVHEGTEIVLYQSMPDPVNLPPMKETRKTIMGVMI